MNASTSNLSKWRDYQRKLQGTTRRKALSTKALLLGSYLVLIGIIYAVSSAVADRAQEGHIPVENQKGGDIRLAKQDLPAVLEYLASTPTPHAGQHHLSIAGKELTVETSIDSNLQRYILRLLRRSQTHRASVVVLRPNTGQILAMVSHEGQGGNSENENLCLKANFPAASLFKIVSAAAVIQARGFTPEKTMFFKGLRHTLYKSQLKQDKGPRTRKTTLRGAFSGSNNPVFGKIGMYELGREMIAEYAGRFLFNQEIPFDLPLEMSTMRIPEDDYGLAEIASGFNRRTLVSPLHAALITAAVAYDGTMVRPWMVRRITDHTGRILYRATRSILGKPLKESAARKLKILMADTVLHGTGRKAFGPLRKKELFQSMALGAKTGTINDHLDQYKYDWLTAYALNGPGGRGICITVLAVHGEKLGIRARDLARYIINYYFKSQE
jgi:cell division protein FtsI/penicillin-binding protein 2